ncbi:MAG: 5'/3'-nucleotidase SurE [Elusimicrobia bacterium]|nr:5'/3'-nucleotidase SurE [Elusimicrobiota bacterium]
MTKRFGRRDSDQPSILVCNDDGVYGLGLKPLIGAMRGLGSVTVVVPDQERSADSHCLTLHKPLRVRQVQKDFYILNGSPADCARFGILGILKNKVDLVVSGINHGYNLGEDVVYSGTVAAAMEGTLLDKQAIAFSQGYGPNEKVSFTAAAVFAKRIAAQVLERGLPAGICLNVNVPPLPRGRLKGTAVSRLGRRIYGTKITGRMDPRGLEYFWLAGKQVSGISIPGTDVAAIEEDKITVTPLHIDATDNAMLQGLKKWDL